MVNYAPLNEAMSALQLKYEEGFANYGSEALSIRSPFDTYYDSEEKRDRSRLYGFTKATFNEFQEPYLLGAHSLGQSFYSIVRDDFIEKSSRRIPDFIYPPVSDNFLLDFSLEPYRAAGLLRKVFYEDYTMEYASQIGSKGILDAIRAATEEMAKKENSLETKPFIATSAGACKYCKDLAKAINDTEYGHSYDKVKFHNGCNCALTFIFK